MSVLLGEGGSGSLLLLLLGDAGLVLSGLSLVLKSLGLDGLSLSLVDSLDQDSLVLELVSLGSHVEVVVDVIIDLTLLAVLAQESSENSLSSDPKDLSRHTSLSGTSALTGTSVTTLSFSEKVQSHSGPGVDSDGLLDDETVLNELANSLSGVSQSNLAGLIRIEPNSALTALGDRSRKTSLKLQRGL